jgi:hypothetical protein
MWGRKWDATQRENATRPSKLPYALMYAGKKIMKHTTPLNRRLCASDQQKKQKKKKKKKTLKLYLRVLKNVS